MISLQMDIVGVMIQIVNEQYGHNIDAELAITNDPDVFPGGEKGLTVFPDDQTCPQMFINADISFDRFPEILAHECAHVLAGPDADHGEAWFNFFSEILEHFAERFGVEVPEVIND